MIFESNLLIRFDQRLTFVNLKNDSVRGNTVGQDEGKQIWIPNLVFGNSVGDTYIQVDSLSSIFVLKEGSGVRKLSKNLEENEEYSGK